MRHSLTIKFLAIALCALSLLAAIVGGLGVEQLLDEGLYEKNLETLHQERKSAALADLANEIAGRHAASVLSNCSQEFIDVYFGSEYQFHLSDPSLWFYTLESQQGEMIHNSYAGHGSASLESFEFVVSPDYPVILDDRDPSSADHVPSQTLPTGEEGESSFRYSVGYGWTDDMGTHYYTLGIYRGPVYLVTLYLLPGAYSADGSEEWALLESAYENRYLLFVPLIAGVTLFALLLTFLFSVAGKKANVRGIHPGGLNSLPIDVYILIQAAAGLALSSGISAWAGKCFAPSPNWGAIVLVLVHGYGLCLLVVALLFALAAQIRAKHGYLWRQSLLGKVCLLSAKGLKWVWQQLTKVYALMPLVWQWLALGGTMLLALLLAILSRSWVVIVLAVLLSAGLILYGAYAFGTLLKSTREMSHGDLSAQVDHRGMLGGFRDFADHLNALAGVAVAAGQNQARSERMKAELITNVSHDIKTPLTSIISYVNLMKRAGSPEEASSYLEVLDRQTLRLKKLIDDLMDLSKAATGNMPVEIVRSSAVEAVNQALGEFGYKLEAAGLTIIFHPPQDSMDILADGRLTWRVLSNLLSNAEKYALPGTRVFIDMSRTEKFVMISIKNVSREPLGINSDGLLERFVRGDTARNTEGSGLGLNIASSLMELQNGQLQLNVDGDLFCVTLVFPAG